MLRENLDEGGPFDMAHPWLELGGSFLGFAGGAVLSIDALCAVRTTLEKRGQDAVREAAKGAQTDYVDSKGKAISSELRAGLWSAKRSVLWARIGFALMTLGFLLDFLSKW